MKTKSGRLMWIGFGLAALLWVGRPAAAQYYDETYIGALGVYHWVGSYPTGINDLGQVIGVSGTDVNWSGTYPFLWDPGFGMVGLAGQIGWTSSYWTAVWTSGINNKGQVCGGGLYYVSMDTFEEYAFRWTPSTPNGPSGTAETLKDLSANGIDDDGVVCGAYQGKPVLWTLDGSITTLPFPDLPPGTDLTGLTGSAVAINNAGQVVVAVWGANYSLHGFLYSIPDQKYTGPAIGKITSTHAAINNKGQVAALDSINDTGLQTGTTNASYYGGMLLRHGEEIDVSSRVVYGWSPYGWGAAFINNSGQIACVEYNGPMAAITTAILYPVAPPSLPKSDFNGDGKPDILFQNKRTGQLAVWYLDGANQTGAAFIYPSQDPAWTCVGCGDFDGDGKPDLLFQNQTTGQLAVWYMNGTYLKKAAYLYPKQDPKWQCVSVQDFNGDGHPDLLFQNQDSGELAVWTMNDNYATKGAFIPIPTFLDPQGPGWKCMGACDFDGLGGVHLLMQNTASLQMYVWTLKDMVLYLGCNVPVPMLQDPAWRAAALDDYDRDWATDVIFQNRNTGQLAIWYMGGISSADGFFVNPLQAPDWQVVGPH